MLKYRRRPVDLGEWLSCLASVGLAAWAGAAAQGVIADARASRSGTALSAAVRFFVSSASTAGLGHCLAEQIKLRPCTLGATLFGPLVYR